ncbi:MAG: (d)CMP kinase [Clostridia bacterium]|nr:(d)CMP kinase [Clostridia bacterium]
MSKVGVIGGGPAGCLAACTAALWSNDVTLIERNGKIGRKLLITGKGRCNVTNACPDIKGFISNVPVNGRFLYSGLYKFMTYDTMTLFEELGVPLKVERGDRVFPVSDKSSDIVDALYGYLKRSGVRVIFDTRVTDIKHDNNRFQVVCEGDKTFFFDRLILATGGASYGATGSTGDGYAFARALGHTVVELSPSLVPIESDDSCCKEMQGLSLKNVGIRILANRTGRTVYSDFGEMLFTHFGVSGPTILSATSHIRSVSPGQYTLFIDLKPALTEEQLDFRILRDFSEQTNKDFKNSLGNLLPSKMIPVIVERSGIDPAKKVNQITKSERLALVCLLKNFRIELTRLRPLSEAIVTSGGIDTKEIDPKTMESKLVPGLYFAGEIIDVDAYTGGFNLQIAFTTGFVAGNSQKDSRGERMFNIAIDGPGGAGKSSISKAVSKELGFIYVDTGALYRAVGLYCLRNGIKTDDTEAVTAALENVAVDFTYIDGEQRVTLNGEDVSEDIRLPEASMAASNVSAIPAVREFLLELQRKIAREKDVLMDGRDIGTVILPDAQLKIFLTASPEVRAKRRYDELIAKGKEVNFDDVLRELKERDWQDSHRETAPLKQADDAVLVDTSDMTFDEVKETIIRLYEERKNG